MALTTVKQQCCPITRVSDVASRVKELREELGLNQAEFAARAGVSAGTIGNIEAGTREGSAKTLIQIATSAFVRVEWLQSGQGPKHASTLGAAKERDEALPLAKPKSPSSAAATVLRIADLLRDHEQDTRDAAALLLKMVASQPGRADEIAVKLEALLAAPAAPKPDPQRNVAIDKTGGRYVNFPPAPGAGGSGQQGPGGGEPAGQSRAPSKKDHARP